MEACVSNPRDLNMIYIICLQIYYHPIYTKRDNFEWNKYNCISSKCNSICVSSRYDKVTPMQCIDATPLDHEWYRTVLNIFFVLTVWTFSPAVLELHLELTKFWSSFSGIRTNTVCILQHQITYHNDECDNFSIIWRPSLVRM